MVSKTRLRLKILELLKIHKVLNTVEICRLCNDRDKRDVDWCYENQGFNINRTWETMCLGRKRNCLPYYLDVYRGGSSGALDILKRKGFVNSVKMRFKDSGTWRRGKATDIFRFWFIYKRDFEELIMSQTLIPHLE